MRLYIILSLYFVVPVCYYCIKLKYKLMINVGHSGSVHKFRLEIKGLVISTSSEFGGGRDLIFPQMKYKTTFLADDVSIVQEVTLIALGADGLHVLNFNISTRSYVQEFKCNCIVSKGRHQKVYPDRILCRDRLNLHYCSLFLYTLRLYVFPPKINNTSGKNLLITLNGEYIPQSFTIKFTAKFAKESQREFYLPYLGNLNRVIIPNTGLSIPNITISYFMGEFIFVKKFNNSSGSTDHSYYLKTVICYSRQLASARCDLHRFIFVAMVKMNVYTKIALNITTRQRHKLYFVVSQHTNNNSIYFSRMLREKGRFSNISLTSTGYVNTLYVDDGSEVYLYKAYCKTCRVIFKNRYCLDEWKIGEFCLKVLYTIYLNIGKGKGDGAKYPLNLTVFGEMQTFNVLTPNKTVRSGETVVIQTPQEYIGVVTNVLITPTAVEYIYIKLVDIYDGRSLYQFLRQKTGYVLALTDCPSGYTGRACNQTCSSGYWGKNCRMNCSCPNDVACDSLSGYCAVQCGPRMVSPRCSKKCPDGFFGPLCEHECHCVHPESCDVINGSCDSHGCQTGWKGENCQIYECGKTHQYGLGCDRPCRCVNNTPCDPITGECNAGCQHPYYGNDCQNKCRMGYFLDLTTNRCDNLCKCDMPQHCQTSDGKCLVGGCKLGWIGDNCNDRCLYGGGSCKHACNCSGMPCNDTTGQCLCGRRRMGRFCENFCPTNKYMIAGRCSGLCRCFKSEMCWIGNGSCRPLNNPNTTLCREGWKGEDCQVKNRLESSIPRAFLLFQKIAVGILLLLLISGLIILLLWKRYNKEYEHPSVRKPRPAETKPSVETPVNPYTRSTVSGITKVEFNTHTSKRNHRSKGRIKVRVAKSQAKENPHAIFQKHAKNIKQLKKSQEYVFPFILKEDSHERRHTSVSNSDVPCCQNSPAELKHDLESQNKLSPFDLATQRNSEWQPRGIPVKINKLPNALKRSLAPATMDDTTATRQSKYQSLFSLLPIYECTETISKTKTTDLKNQQEGATKPSKKTPSDKEGQIDCTNIIPHKNGKKKLRVKVNKRTGEVYQPRVV